MLLDFYYFIVDNNFRDAVKAAGRIRTGRIPPRKHVSYYGIMQNIRFPSRQHELDHTDHTAHTAHTNHTDHKDHTDHTDHTDHMSEAWIRILRTGGFLGGHRSARPPPQIERVELGL